MKSYAGRKLFVNFGNSEAVGIFGQGYTLPAGSTIYPNVVSGNLLENNGDYYANVVTQNKDLADQDEFRNTASLESLKGYYISYGKNTLSLYEYGTSVGTTTARATCET